MGSGNRNEQGGVQKEKRKVNSAKCKMYGKQKGGKCEVGMENEQWEVQNEYYFRYHEVKR